MRRLWSRFSQFPTTRHVVGDGPHCNPLPVGDSVAQGLRFNDIAAYFSALVHQWAEPNAKPRFVLTPNLCVLTLMPVTKTANGEPTTAWVPFLIDTGSASSYFTGASIEALGLDRADHVAIMQKPVLWETSTGHFNDINLLGTDFLRYGVLSVDYSAQHIDLKLKDPSALTIMATNRFMSFEVNPQEPVVYSLKDAIKKALKPKADHAAAIDIIVKDPKDERVMKSNEPLKLGVEYVFEIPPKPKSSLFSRLSFSRG